MVPVNVILGVAGTAGFTFGLVRTRRAANRGLGPAGHNDADTVAQESADLMQTPTSLEPVEDH
jgi:hypothetical protein